MAPRAAIMIPVGVSAAVAVAYQTVFKVTERPSWPPDPDAITTDGAMAAVAKFCAGDPVPDDVGLSYQRSTAATIEPWGGGPQFYPRLFDDIASARSSIHILMFGWKPGVPGGKLTELLLAKLAAGVEVRILVDSFGSRPHGKSKEMFTQLADAGAEIVVNSFLPPRRRGLYPHATAKWRRSLLCRADHRKLYVLDGTVAWTGGAGVEDHFYDGRFYDVMVRVTGDVVRQAQAVFLMSASSHGAHPPGDLDPYFPQPSDAGSIPTALTQVVPGGYVSATQAARTLIDGATQRLDIMNPYLTDADMVERIIRAAERGVAVRVVVSKKSNNAPATFALRHRYDEFAEAGIEVWEYPGAVVHAKLIVADDHVQFGTLNLDAWSLYRDFELALIAGSSETANLFEQRVFEPMIEGAERGQPVTDHGLRVLGSVANRISYLL